MRPPKKGFSLKALAIAGDTATADKGKLAPVRPVNKLKFDRVHHTLSHGHDVRYDVPVINSEPLSGSTVASHDFVANQEDSVFVAKLAKTLQVTLRRDDNTISSGNGFDEDGSDGLRVFIVHLFLKWN